VEALRELWRGSVAPVVLPDEPSGWDSVLTSALELLCNQGEIFISAGIVFLEPGFATEVLKPLCDHRLSLESAMKDVDVHIRATVGVGAPRSAAQQLLTGIDTMVKQGRLAEAVLPFLWRSNGLAKSDYPAATRMLCESGVLIELPLDDSGEAQWLLLMRMAEERPKNVLSMWPPTTLKKGQTQLGVRFNLLGARVPAGFVECCLAQALTLGKLLSCWRGGLVLMNVQHGARVRLELRRGDSEHGTVLEVDVRAAKALSVLWEVLTPLVTRVRDVFDEFAGLNVVEQLVCPRCRTEGRWDDASTWPLSPAFCSAPEFCDGCDDLVDLYAIEEGRAAMPALDTPKLGMAGPDSIANWLSSCCSSMLYGGSSARSP